MISTDRRSWETRSALDLFGFAVDPDNADQIFGAGPDGLTESGDGGRHWSLADGPQLVTLSWQADRGLWGADLVGAVWRHGSAGWERAGTIPGDLATPAALFAAAHDSDATGIYRSTDDGRTWTSDFATPSRRRRRLR